MKILRLWGHKRVAILNFDSLILFFTCCNDFGHLLIKEVSWISLLDQHLKYGKISLQIKSKKAEHKCSKGG